MISDQIRNKQGPLARVWLASHWERKISKSQFLQTNLEKTIDAITNDQQEAITLRVSGQLLLGVVRIYSRKTRYLLEDCNEALVKIKLAFKKGDVNMPDIHQSVANANTITLQDKLTEFDILLPDLPFNTNPHLNDRDPVFDSLNELSTQDITLSEINNFSFGNWETGRGGQEGIEVGRRDNEPGFADTPFDLDAIADPLKDMNLNDNALNNGLNNDDVNFDFDMGGEDYGDDAGFNGDDFELQPMNDADAPLDTLMQVGIVEDESHLFNVDDTTEPTVRRRKRLVVDKVTEISAEDFRRYTLDTSSIINKDIYSTTTSKNKPTQGLTKPAGTSVGAELEDMFNRMSRKRRASSNLVEVSREAPYDDPFAVPTPGADNPSAFHFDDNGADFDAGGFDEEAYARANSNAMSDDVDNYDDIMGQSTQTMNSSTRRTLANLEGEFAIKNTVMFGELASSSTKKADAARLFYDILLLSTKDMIKVKQDRPYGEIQINAPTSISV